ncbi:DUF2017 family protein [Microbacterium sp. 2FI]|uniref:DUF2017 family protein n=1 Tax=Microbacterium sp. 2FI TaxID=2502193 RepID=UPI0010F833FB|nr:DUF2017 family protein [Microbacterium sp. 2FI]
MTRRGVALELTRLEAAHLSGLVSQFEELVIESSDAAADPAVVRLVPDAYADGEDAREFRRLTESDLLGRRRADAAAVRASLVEAADISDDPDDPSLLESVEVRLSPDDAQAWLRTLAAIRLVLATRLGITDADDHDDGDPRFGVYDWLGYRLHGLVTALDADA